MVQTTLLVGTAAITTAGARRVPTVAGARRRVPAVAGAGRRVVPAVAVAGRVVPAVTVAGRVVTRAIRGTIAGIVVARVVRRAGAGVVTRAIGRAGAGVVTRAIGRAGAGVVTRVVGRTVAITRVGLASITRAAVFGTIGGLVRVIFTCYLVATGGGRNEGRGSEKAEKNDKRLGQHGVRKKNRRGRKEGGNFAFTKRGGRLRSVYKEKRAFC